MNPLKINVKRLEKMIKDQILKDILRSLKSLADEINGGGVTGAFEKGLTIGQFSYYIPHTMKEILNQEATYYGEGPIPTADNA